MTPAAPHRNRRPGRLPPTRAPPPPTGGGSLLVPWAAGLHYRPGAQRGVALRTATGTAPLATIARVIADTLRRRPRPRALGNAASRSEPHGPGGPLPPLFPPLRGPWRALCAAC